MPRHAIHEFPHIWRTPGRQIYEFRSYPANSCAANGTEALLLQVKALFVFHLADPDGALQVEALLPEQGAEDARGLRC
jgi:hypothetical protein